MPEQGGVNLVEFGRLVQSVETLTEEVQKLKVEVQEMRESVAGGKGLVAGMLLAAGGLGAIASEVLQRTFLK